MTSLLLFLVLMQDLKGGGRNWNDEISRYRVGDLELYPDPRPLARL